MRLCGVYLSVIVLVCFVYKVKLVSENYYKPKYHMALAITANTQAYVYHRGQTHFDDKH